tara:strand:- start:335 stop:619 length:285 start_codon:yes stop_codon:yes gene_type:complete
MDSQLPTNQEQPQNQITPEQLEEMKMMARQQAIQQITQQRQSVQQPEVVYVRRNLTVAEVIVVFIISCGLVFGIQASWNFATNVLPKIEIKVNQ